MKKLTEVKLLLNYLPTWNLADVDGMGSTTSVCDFSCKTVLSTWIAAPAKT